MGIFSISGSNDQVIPWKPKGKFESEQAFRKRVAKYEKYRTSESKNLTPKIGEIWKVKQFYFDNSLTSSKPRPAIIVDIIDDKYICLEITSKVEKHENWSDSIHIDKWLECGLTTNSTCLYKTVLEIKTTKRGEFLFKYGDMDKPTFARIRSKFWETYDENDDSIPIIENVNDPLRFLKNVKLK